MSIASQLQSLFRCSDGHGHQLKNANLLETPQYYNPGFWWICNCCLFLWSEGLACEGAGLQSVAIGAAAGGDNPGWRVLQWVRMTSNAESGRLEQGIDRHQRSSAGKVRIRMTGCRDQYWIRMTESGLAWSSFPEKHDRERTDSSNCSSTRKKEGREVSCHVCVLLETHTAY